MALKSIRSILTGSFLFFILFTTLVPFGNTHALNNDSDGGNLPLLDVLVGPLKNDQADYVRGIYIPELLTAPVVQQPSRNREFISIEENTLTQFHLASKFGSIGLLAHNYLAGASFSQLERGQKFYLIYADGRMSAFVVTEILRYQALDPNSTSSKFVDLDTNRLLTARDLFTKVYKRRGQVIFQTCIAAGQEPSWGRLFIISEPYPQT
jgi:hypothetical protein